jgi:hypothetical protein
MRSTTILLLGVLVSTCFPQSVLAKPDRGHGQAGVGRTPREIKPHYSEFGHILWMETGWGPNDTLAMAMDADVPFQNAEDFRNGGGFGPCGGITPEGHFQVATSYALDPEDRGVKLHEAVLLSAFLSGRKVRVLVKGCIYNKPRIIAVGIDTRQ